MAEVRAAGSANDIAASAMRWLGRGQSYPAVVREIAWTAVRAVGGSDDDVEWLSPLIDAQLVERLDELPGVVREAGQLGLADHACERPHDLEGAQALAEIAAHDAAVEHLSTAYLDLLDWGVGLLLERQAALTRRRRRSGKERDERLPVHCEVPQRILDGLSLRAERPGWPHRRAA